MMGKKTLADIKKNLKARMEEESFDISSYCDTELRKLDRTLAADRLDIATLESIRDALRGAVAAKRGKRRRAKAKQ